MNSRIISMTMDSNATNNSDEFGVKAGMHLSIGHSVAATSSPTGTLYLQRYNTALADWETDSDADAEFENPAAGASNGTANFTYPAPGRYRVRYVSDSGGAADAITITIRMSDA